MIAVHGWLSSPPIVTRCAGWPDRLELAARADRLIDREARFVDEIASSVPVSWRSLAAHPVAALLDVSHSASMVVVGARGNGEVESLLVGSVSDDVVRHAACSVVVVPEV